MVPETDNLEQLPDGEMERTPLTHCCCCRRLLGESYVEVEIIEGGAVISPVMHAHAYKCVPWRLR